MSDFNVYDMLEAEDLARTASVKHSQETFREAVFEANERFGSYLRSAEDQGDFLARLSNVKRDFKKVVSAYLETTPAILTSVAKAVQSQGRTMTASDVDFNDRGVLQFFYQFEDNGLDASASGESQWEWLKNNIDYDVLQDAIDQAHEYGELSWTNADALAYELQQNFFGSLKTAGQFAWMDEDDYSTSTTPDGHQLWIGLASHDDGVESWEEGEWSLFDPGHNEIASGTEVNASQARIAVENAYESRTASKERGASFRREALSQDEVAGEIDRIFSEAEGWEPITTERLDWYKGDIEFYGWVGVVNQNEDTVFEFRGGTDESVKAAEYVVRRESFNGFVPAPDAGQFQSSRKRASVLRWEPYDEMGSVYAKIPGVGAVLEARADGTWNVYIDESFENTVAWGIEEDLEQAKNKCEIAAYRKFGWPGEIVGKKKTANDYSQMSDEELKDELDLVFEFVRNGDDNFFDTGWEIKQELKSRGISYNPARD